MKSRTISAAVIATAALLIGPAYAFSGAGSFYNVETGNQVACGGFGKNSGWTVALNYAQWDGGSHCGQQITIRYEGKSQVATITDRCESCGGYGGIDLTPDLFSSFASQDRGIIQLSWDYGAGQPEPKPEPPTTSKPPPPPPSSTWTPPPPPPSTTWTPPPPPPPPSSSSTSWSSSSTPSSSSSSSTWTPSSSSSESSSAGSVNGTTSSASSAFNSTSSFNTNATSTGTTTFNNATSVITSDGATQSGTNGSGSGGSTSSLPGGSLAHVNRLVIQMANMVRSASATASSA